MNNKKKLNFKMITMTSILIASLFFLQQKSFKAVGSSINQNLKYGETTTVRTNMLDANSSVVTQATMINLVGTNNKITATFAYLPRTSEKIMAVLTDENAGGVVQTKFLNEDNTVVFDNIPDSVKVPGIHLYKQSSTDADFVLRKENFIASTSYLMPSILKKTEVPQYNHPVKDASGNVIKTSAVIDVYETTMPNVWSAAVPLSLFSQINAPKGLTQKDVFAVVIAEDANGNPINANEPHKQWVSTDYKEVAEPSFPYLCRFEFAVPAGTKKVCVHLYNRAMENDKFLCSFDFVNQSS